jgi:threonine aldolase
MADAMVDVMCVCFMRAFHACVSRVVVMEAMDKMSRWLKNSGSS